MTIVNQLTSKYGTRDPVKIAEAMNYLIIHVPLNGVRGFYQYVKRNHIIYLDSNLADQEIRFVCAHELGHSLLHRSANRIFMDTRTFLKTSHYEREADEFAAELILPDDEISECAHLTVSQIAMCYGLREALVQYRVQRIRKSPPR